MPPPNQHKKKVQFSDLPPSPTERPLKQIQVDDLKSLLKKKHLSVSGKKAGLIERLRKYPNGAGPKTKVW